MKHPGLFNQLIAFSLHQRLLVLAIAIALMAYGAMRLQQMSIDVLPDLNRPSVTLMTEAPGMAPEEVEQLVSTPLEIVMQGMPGVLHVRSTSSIGLSIVTIEFDWGTDIHRNRQQVSERLLLARTRLPPDITPHMGAISSLMGEVMLVAMPLAEHTDPMMAREVADWIIRPRLLALPGVSQIIVMGGDLRLYRVEPDLQRMRDLGIRLQQVEEALQGFAGNSNGGTLQRGAHEYLIRPVGRTNSLDDLRNLPVAWRDQQSIVLQQIANVRFAAAQKRGDAGFNGAPAVLLSIQKQPGADTVHLTRQLETALQETAQTLPAGIEQPAILFRQADFIEASIGNVSEALRDGALLVTVVLFLFLLNFRTTFIALAAIPVSLLITVLIFRWFELSINTMTLGGLAIAIGELVDDAVVGMENVFRRLRENSTSTQAKPPLTIIINATAEVRSGIVYATFIIVLVFIPLFALPGIEGRLFTPLGIAYIVSILSSMLVAVTLTPILCYYLLPHMNLQVQGDSFIVTHLKRGNRILLQWSFQHARWLLAATLLAVLLAVASAASLPRSFLPDFNEGTLTVSLLLNPGTSLEESVRIGRLAERLMLEIPEVRQLGRRTGRAELDEHAEGTHVTELEIELQPSTRSRSEIMADIRQQLAPLPVSLSLGQPISHRLDHLLSGIQAEVALKIFGADLDILRGLAAAIEEKFQHVEGLVDIRTEKQTLIPQQMIRIDYARAATYGIHPGQLLTTLETLLAGREITQIIDGNRRFALQIRIPESQRDPDMLGQLLIDTPGGHVPLHYLANLQEQDGPNQIHRDDGHRRIVIAANTDGRNSTALIAELRALLSAQILPEGYRYSLEGQFRAREDATRLIAGLGLLSLLLVTSVLYGRYRSWRLTAMILGSIPFALVGSIAALHLSGQSLSVASLIGFITLTGIATRNGILKISHYLNLARQEHLPFGKPLIIRGSLERLPPVLMTAIVTAIALIPLLLNADSPGKEILHPVAVVIFGGLLSATLLDTLLTPLLFWLWGEPPLQRILADEEAGTY